MRAGVDVDFRKRKFIDVQNIFHKMEQRTLVAAYKFYCGKDLADAHSAEADTLATYEVLKAQLDRYGELQNDVAALAEFSTRAESADFAGRILYNEKGKRSSDSANIRAVRSRRFSASSRAITPG